MQEGRLGETLRPTKVRWLIWLPRRGSQTVNRSSAGRPSIIDSFDAATSIIN
jgi:hypothetical protein